MIKESSSKKSTLSDYIVSISYVFWGLGTIFVNMLMLFVSGSKVVLIVNICMLLIVSFPSFFYLKKSPIFLNKFGKKEELIITLLEIGTINSSDATREEIELYLNFTIAGDPVADKEIENPKMSVFSYLKSPKNLLLFIILASISIQQFVIIYGIVFSM